MVEIGWQILAMLFVVAIIAGWVDTVAGGGGLIALPALLLAGVPPAAALATNKLQGSAGTLTASIYFIRKKTVDLNAFRWPIVATFVGSVFGSWLVLTIDYSQLIKIIPFFLISMGMYFLFSPSISDEQAKNKITIGIFSLCMAPLLGFYDGFFGPGTGSFMALALVLLLGYGLPKATAHAKILNFVSNISSLGYFVIFGEVFWLVGLVMIVGQFMGALLGAKMIIKKGTAMIRPIVVIMCTLMSINLLYKSFG